MQPTRKIVYASISNTSGAQTVYSAATTWGELKKEFSDIEAKSIGMKPWIKGDASDPSNSKGFHLSGDGTTLPTGDFVLYFLVEKNDSGRK